MSRRDIADYLSLTLETVSRALSEFHRKGNLKVSGDSSARLLYLMPRAWPNLTAENLRVSCRRVA
jgi:hypothetical protein